MKQIITKDSSLTYFNDEFNEYYHSLVGARTEALEKYTRPALQFLEENKMIANSKENKNALRELNVLDFCYGLGYNCLIFLEELRKVDNEIKVNIIGIDNDPEIVEKSKKLFKGILDKYAYSDKKTSFRVEIGDAAEFIRKADKMHVKFNVCFFDPFSPKKCPKLWTKEVFDDVYRAMTDKSILITYSCAKSVRQNMENAGFKVKDGPFVGMYAPATIGIKN